jgi:hypothetical protein
MTKSIHEEEQLWSAEEQAKRFEGKAIHCSNCGHLCHCRPIGKYADKETKTSVICGFIHPKFDIPTCVCDNCKHLEENQLIKSRGMI